MSKASDTNDTFEKFKSWIETLNFYFGTKWQSERQKLLAHLKCDQFDRLLHHFHIKFELKQFARTKHMTSWLLAITAHSYIIPAMTAEETNSSSPHLTSPTSSTTPGNSNPGPVGCRRDRSMVAEEAHRLADATATALPKASPKNAAA